MKPYTVTDSWAERDPSLADRRHIAIRRRNLGARPDSLQDLERGCVCGRALDDPVHYAQDEPRKPCPRYNPRLDSSDEDPICRDCYQPAAAHTEAAHRARNAIRTSAPCGRYLISGGDFSSGDPAPPCAQCGWPWRDHEVPRAQDWGGWARTLSDREISGLVRHVGDLGMEQIDALTAELDRRLALVADKPRGWGAWAQAGLHFDDQPHSCSDAFPTLNLEPAQKVTIIAGLEGWELLLRVQS